MFRVFALLLLVTGVAAAQGPPPYFPWWESPLTGRMGLSEDQHEQIREILKRYRERMIDQRAAVEKADAEMADLFGEETLGSAQADEAIERLVTARANLTRSLTKISLELRQILTPEQWRRLRYLQGRMEKYRGRRPSPRGGGPRGGPGPRERRGPGEDGRPPKPRPPEQL